MVYFLVLFLILVLVVGVWLTRRYVMGWMGDKETTSAPGFTLGDLRDLHRSGAMSDEEFEKAKTQLVEGMKRASAVQEARAREAAAKKDPQARRAPDQRHRPPT